MMMRKMGIVIAVAAALGLWALIDRGVDKVAEATGVERVECNALHDITCGARSAWSWMKPLMNLIGGREAEANEPEWVLSVSFQVLDFNGEREEPVASLRFHEVDEGGHRSRENCLATAKALEAVLEQGMTAHIAMASSPEEIGYVAMPMVSCYTPERGKNLMPMPAG